MTLPPDLTIRFAEFAEILLLRDRVIIQGTDRASPEFPGDCDADTRHIGIFRGSDAVCCASFYPRPWEGRPAWQLRGMATDEAWRGQGLGKVLLQFAEEQLVRKSGAALLWCHARSTAVQFYEQQGWTRESDEFEVEGVGPHIRMVKMVKQFPVMPETGLR